MAGEGNDAARGSGDVPGAATPTGGKRVAVFGAGVAGLTAAHELVERGFDVSVFDAQEVPGGKAISFLQNGLEGEHGFRFFPGFYRNVTDSMGRIPCGADDSAMAPEASEAGRPQSGEATVGDALTDLKSAWFAARLGQPQRLTRRGAFVHGMSRSLSIAGALVMAVAAIALYSRPTIGTAWVLGAAVLVWLVADSIHLGIESAAQRGPRSMSLELPTAITRARRAQDTVWKAWRFLRWPASIAVLAMAVTAAVDGRPWRFVIGLGVLAFLLFRPGVFYAAVWTWTTVRSIPKSVLPGRLETIYALMATMQVVMGAKQRRFLVYENQSWWVHMKAWKFSPEYRLAFATGLTRSFVATRAEEMSARTGALILAQLMYDNCPFFTRDQSADRVLNGPTQEAWIDRWVDHLRDQGVRFNPAIGPGEADGSAVRVVRLLPTDRTAQNGALDPRTALDAEPPTVADFQYRRARSVESDTAGGGPRRAWTRIATASDGQGPEPFDHYILAVSAVGARRILQNSDRAVAVDNERILSRQVRPVVVPLQRAKPENELADLGDPSGLAGVFDLQFGWMNGIVYHLDRRIDFPSGHILCLDSEWALTVLDQAPVWAERKAGPYVNGENPPDVRSIISVNVSDWHTSADRIGKPAASLTIDEVRCEVWRQLQDHIPELHGIKCPGEGSVIFDKAIAPEINTLSVIDEADGPLDRDELSDLDGGSRPIRELLADRVLLAKDPDAGSEIEAGVETASQMVQMAKVPRRDDRRPGPGRTADPERQWLANAEPLLINTQRSWHSRPAAPTSFANLTLSGDYVRTDTDFASMEAANESARRAVRHILRSERYEGRFPEVFELDEPKEIRNLVRLFRALDSVMLLVGLPHLLKVLATPVAWGAGFANFFRGWVRIWVEMRFIDGSASDPSAARRRPRRDLPTRARSTVR